MIPRGAWLAAGALALWACGPSVSAPTGSPAPSATSPTATEPSTTSRPSVTAAPPASPDPMSRPWLAGSYPVDSSGRELAMRCYGEGNPVVFLESGEGAIEEFTREPLVRLLAERTMVCLYNRAGRAPSDAAPDRPREAEDVADDFHALVRAAAIAPPYVLFGRSFGGMIVTFYAQEYPEDVAGVVVFDTPAPGVFTRETFPEGFWDHPDNLEHLNVAIGYETRFHDTPVHVEPPLIYVSTTSGEAVDPADRDYWLATSDASSSVVLDGGMEVIRSEADRLAEVVLSLR